MAVTPPIGFNFGSDAATSPDVTFDTTAYNATPGYGWSVAGNIASAFRDGAPNARLRGIAYQVNNGSLAEFRVDLPNGTYDMRLALGDAGGGGHSDMKARFFDGADTSPLVTVSLASVPEGQWADATGVVRTSAADWVSNNATASVTITNSYLRMELGNSTGDYSTISHLSFAEAAGGGGGGNGPLIGGRLINKSILINGGRLIRCKSPDIQVPQPAFITPRHIDRSIWA